MRIQTRGRNTLTAIALSLGGCLWAAVFLVGCAEFERMRQNSSRQDLVTSPEASLAAMDVPALLDMADTARGMGHPEEAIGYLNGVLSRDGGNTRALLGMGGIQLDSGNPAEASAAFDKVLALSPGNAEALEGQGRLRLQAGDFSQATSLFQSALASDPGRWRSLDGLGVMAARDGKFETALPYFSQALAIKPGNPELLTHRGEARYKLNDPTGAMADFDGAIAADPGYEPAYRHKAELLTQQGREQEALGVLGKIMGAADADRTLGEFMAALGKSAVALHKESQGEDGPSGEPLPVALLLTLIGGAVFIGASGLMLALFPADGRLQERREGMGLGVNRDAKTGDEPSLIKGVPDTPWNRAAAMFLPRGEAAKMLDLGRLTRAGYRSLTALATYHAIRTAMMVVLPLLTIFIGTAVLNMSLQQLYPYVAGAFVLGMIAPSFVLDRKVEQRLTRLRNALPDALDLLVVCAESGLGLNAALLRVGHELRLVHPEFSAELAVANGEIRAGLEREVALNNMVERTGLEDLKVLVMLLIQSTKLGTSLAETLRIYAEEFRDKRMQAAEEEAAKLSTKIIFPLVICFMPAFFIVAVGPAFTGVLKTFK